MSSLSSFWLLSWVILTFLLTVQVEEMDGAKFAKFCRDTKIVDKKFTNTDVDLTYAKAKAKVTPRKPKPPNPRGITKGHVNPICLKPDSFSRQSTEQEIVPSGTVCRGLSCFVECRKLCQLLLKGHPERPLA